MTNLFDQYSATPQWVKYIDKKDDKKAIFSKKQTYTYMRVVQSLTQRAVIAELLFIGTTQYYFLLN